MGRYCKTLTGKELHFVSVTIPKLSGETRNLGRREEEQTCETLRSVCTPPAFRKATQQSQPRETADIGRDPSLSSILVSICPFTTFIWLSAERHRGLIHDIFTDSTVDSKTQCGKRWRPRWAFPGDRPSQCIGNWENRR
jgi:hypothetical protein